MAESLSEVFSSVEGLEATEEGRRKSKFKILKSFFGKKEKRDSEEFQEERVKRSTLSGVSISLSFLKPVPEIEAMDSKRKSSVGTKAISHDSIFSLEPEREKSSTRDPSSEHLGGGATQIPPLHPHKPRVRPTDIQTETTSKAFEKMHVGDKAPKSPKKQSSPYRPLTPMKSISELASEPDQSESSPSSAQQPLDFSTPASTQKCLDSSAARHKMTLNPHKQKKKATYTTVKSKQEEPHLPGISKEKATTKSKQADQKEKKRDGTGTSNQEQSSKTASQEKRTHDQAPTTHVAISTEYSILEGNGRRHRRTKDEWGYIERGLSQSTQMHDMGPKAKFTPTEMKASGEHSSMEHVMEKQVTGQLTAPEAETTASQKVFSDKRDIERKRADLETKRGSAAQPIPQDVEGSMASVPPPHHGDEASGTKKIKDKAYFLPWAGSRTTQEETTVSRAAEAQLHMHPSNISSEEEEPSRPGLHKFHSRKELALDAPSVYKEKHHRNVLQTFPRSASRMTSTTAQGKVSMKRWPQRTFSQSLTQSKEKEASSESKSTSEYESSSEVLLVPGQSSQATRKPKDKEILLKTRSLDTVLSNIEQQVPLEYSSQFVGKPKTEEASSDPRSSSEEHKSSAEVTSGHSSQSLEFEECSDSKRFIMASVPEDQLAPKSHFQALQGFEEKEVSTKSSSYIEKYKSSEDMSSSEGDQPLEHPKQPKHRGQNKVSLVSKSTSKKWSVSGKMKPSGYPSPPTVSPTIQQQASTSRSISTGESQAVEPVPPSHTVKSWMNPKSEREDISNPNSTTMEEIVSMEAPPPQHHSQPPTRPIFEQEVSSGPEIAIVEESLDTQPPRYSPQPSVRPKIKEVSLGAESAALKKSVPMEPLSSKKHPPYQKSASERGISLDPRPHAHLFKPWVKHQANQPLPSLPESIAVEEDSSMEPLLSHLSQSMIQPKVYQSVSSEYESIAAKVISTNPLPSSQALPNPQGQEISESTSVEDATLMEPLSPSQPLVKTKSQLQMTKDSMSTSAHKFKHVSAVTESSEAEENISVQPVPPRCPSQPRPTPTFEQISDSPDTSLLPRIPPKLLMGSVIKQPVSEKSVSTSAPQRRSVEPMSSRFPSQSRGIPMFKEGVSADPENYIAEDSTSVKLRPRRHHSQPPMSSEAKEVAPGSMRASGEWSGPVGPMPSKYPSQLCLGPEFEQKHFSNPEGVATEEGISREVQLSRHPSQAIIKHKVLKIASSFEGSAIKGSSSWKPLPPKCPTPFLMRSKVQELTARLENATAQKDSSKKPQLTKAPSKTYVKFMAEQIFSESPPEDTAIYAKPLPQSHPPKGLIKPKREEQEFLSHWGDDSKGDILLKKLPMKHPFQSSGRPEEPEEALSYSKSVPVKWSSSKGQMSARELSQPLEMLEYRQEASLSVSYPEDWKRAEGQLPSTQPFQALNVSELQPPILSAASVNVPVEWSPPEEHLTPSQPTQAFRISEYHKQHVFPSSTSAAAEGTTSEKGSGSRYMPKSSASPKKTKERIQAFEELIKSTPTSTIKPGKFTAVPTQKASISRDIYFKEEVPKSPNGDKSPPILSTSKADIENVFGVRLRPVLPRKSEKGYEKTEDVTPPPSVPFGPILSLINKEQSMRKSSSQGFHGTLEKPSSTDSFAEKLQGRLKPEGSVKKQGVYRLPGKPPGSKSDYTTTEPSWISMAKQKQRSYGERPRSRAEARAETKEPRCEVAYELTLQALEKEIEDLPRRFSSSVPAQDRLQTKQPKSEISVAFQDQRMLRSPFTGERDTKRSLNLPPRFQQPEEPVWFSMAQKKAKAWSHIAEIMQ
ncbi:acrosomal protein KIAA1210 homolog [Nannospalax galili]|uniref:acrosomal protein KIAA1210 homolog n=1 Tax=Nannospalax galili TaxID=1026970 RepID=UPI00111C2BE7|nr:acrosomal protein KIAA1210 homolog [Nannospalax galili]